MVLGRIFSFLFPYNSIAAVIVAVVAALALVAGWWEERLRAAAGYLVCIVGVCQSVSSS